MRNEPTANEGACNSHEEVAENPEPGALHDLASQPSGNEADQQYDQETFTRYGRTSLERMGSPTKETMTDALEPCANPISGKRPTPAASPMGQRRIGTWILG